MAKASYNYTRAKSLKRRQKEKNQMNIRRANENDIPRLIELLEQVLQIHADIRPDIFIPGTTKYTNEELSQMIKDDTKPVSYTHLTLPTTPYV
mgnify:CR=1 FL=1